MSAPRTETRPWTYRLALKDLLTLPFRICNPPPAVGKVRSCSVTPLIKIRLEDVLDRKHLPPLGLKDFEEWLLYVEMCPENLYFTLWLREYTAKYHQWAAESKIQRKLDSQHRMQQPVPSSSHLAMFYARAKQTFFMPNALYELDLPSDMLAPFHTSDFPLNPDPVLFNEISSEVQLRLQERLDRFVKAQFNNVGNNRVLCGILAGIIFCIVGFIVPIVVNLTHGYSRWDRLEAFPGLWIGLTVFLSACHGICLSVYVFGDLRQLHKFELARPPISDPRHLRSYRRRPSLSLPFSAPPPPPSMIVPLTRPPRLSVPPPPAAHIVDNRLSRSSTRSSQDSFCSTASSSDSSYEDSDSGIEISAAYYDMEPVDGPATSPLNPDFDSRLAAKNDEANNNIYTNTASFIHPYDFMSDVDSVYDISKLSPEDRQPISPFDFDALPPRASNIPPKCTLPPVHEIREVTADFSPLSGISPTTLLERIQMKCNPRRWLLVRRGANTSTTPRDVTGKLYDSAQIIEKDEHVQKQNKAMRAVPAFTSLTPILSPVVKRGQWEIVMRSSLTAFLISWIIIGSVLAIPSVQ